MVEYKIENLWVGGSNPPYDNFNFILKMIYILLKSYNDKLIPRNIWVACKNSSDALPPHLGDLFSRNKDWQPTICGNDCKDDFMATAFGGTSVHWAYQMIHPELFFAKADIWRYSVLYTYGGYYSDDDSDMRTNLDEVSL